MSSSREHDLPERALLAAGTKTYACAAYQALDKVPEALGEIVMTLKRLGFTTVVRSPGYRLNPKMISLRADVERAAAAAPVVVVYYTGHGAQPSRGAYYLVGPQSRPAALRTTGLAARDLLELLIVYDDYGDPLPADQQPTVLVILDCCFSGSAGTAILGEALRDIGNPSTWVIASAGALEYAQQGLFVKAFCDELRRPTVGSSQRFVDPLTVVEAVNDTVGHTQQALLFPPATGAVGIPPFFPNPGYQPGLAGLTVADQQHWLSRVRGGPEESTTGFYITGRTGRIRAAEDLAVWMMDPAPKGLAVVTGSPGSGKSALLSLPVLLTEHSQRRDLVRASAPGSLIERTASLVPLQAPVIAVHARGLNTDQIGAAIARALGRDAGTASALLEGLEAAPQPDERVVIVDAVDEAVSPGALLGGLLVPLSRHPGVRVVAGARRHVLARISGIDMTIDLDASEYRDPGALTGYIHQLLVAAAEPGVITCYQRVADTGDAEVGVTIAVAEAIAQRATAREAGAESFLIGRLLALAVRDRPEPADMTSPGWQSELPASLAQAFDEDLARLGDKQAVARVLLEALAWAKGPGLPWETIWAPVARALARQEGIQGQSPVNNDDVRWLLDKAGAYVVEDLGPGNRSVFRPFHELLGAHLRGEPQSEQIASDGSAKKTWEQRRLWTEKAITDALIAGLPADAVINRNWAVAHPYLRTYLVQHAATAGTEALAMLVQDIDFLAVADRVTLSPLLSPTVPELRDTARIYRRALALLGEDMHANKAYLQEASVALKGTSAESDRAGIVPLYHTHLESVIRDDSLLTISNPGGEVSSVAFGTTADGQLLLAAADDDAVRLWDPVTGGPVGEPLTSPGRWITSVAFGTTADGQLLLAAADSRAVRLWDPVTGGPVGEPLTGTPEEMHAVAFGTTADGQLLLAIGGDDGTVRLWDPITRTPVGEPFIGGWAERCSVAFGTTADGQLLLAIADQDTVWLWNPINGNPPEDPLLTTEDRAEIAFGTTPDGQLLLATADGKTVQVWDPITGNPAGEPLTGHGSLVASVAFGSTADGHLLLASGGADGTVRLWDPIDVRPADEPVTRAGGWVRSVAFGTTAGGELLLASGNYDGAVWLWNPVSGTPIEAVAYPGGWINDLAFGTTADGQLLLAYAGGNKDRDGAVWLWDPLTNGPIGEPLISPGHAVTSMAIGRTADGKFLLAVVSNGQLELWDLLQDRDSREPLPFPDMRPDKVAFGTADGGRLLLAIERHGTVELMDPIDGSRIGEPLISPFNAVASMAFGSTTNGQLLLAANSVSNSTVWLLDPLAESLASELMTSSGGVDDVAFGATPDGQLVLASAARNTVQFWDVSSKSCFMTFRRRCNIESVAIAWPFVAIGDYEGVCVMELLL